VPLLQKKSGWQSALVEQVVLHTPLVQVNPDGQVVAVWAGHVPFRHVDWARTLSVPEQLAAAPQAFVGYEHSPSARPAQVPPHVRSLPQEARFPCGFPDATGVHVPRNPAMSQAIHGLVQAWSQQ
jgi:hypothetical protein